MKPYQVLDPVEIPGWGQIHGEILQDAVTEAEFRLKTEGALYAMIYLPRLDFMTQNGGWRAPLAGELALRIRRLAALEMDFESRIGETDVELLSTVL